MAKNKLDTQLYWFSDFLGMNQRQNWDVIPPNQSMLLRNVTMDKPGALTKRKGSDLLATTQAGDGVYGLIQYISNTKTGKVHAVRSTDLDKYNDSTDLWETIDSGQFTAQTKVQSVNFKNRVYHISTSDNLCYDAGGACTDVGAGGNEIRGNSIAIAQINYLYVGGVTYIGGIGAVNYQDRVYYSIFDSQNNVATHQLYDSGDTMATSTRWFTLNAPCRGLFRFGTAEGLLYAFTENECIRWNMRLENNATGLDVMFPIGLANPRAITECNGYMVWMSPDKRIWAWNGNYGKPQNIGWPIEDDTNEEAIINLISNAQVEHVCAGSIGNTVHFSIGDINYFGEAMTNCVIKGLFTQNMNYVYWTLDTYPVKPVIFANAFINNKRVLLFGADGVDDVYQMYEGKNDGTVAVDARIKTMFAGHGTPLNTHIAKFLWLKFRPQSSQSTYPKISYAKNGKFTYIPISDPDAGTPLTKYGKVDMYESDYATNTDKILPINFPGGVKYRTISLEIANAQLNEGFEISGIGIGYSIEPLDIRPE